MIRSLNFRAVRKWKGWETTLSNSTTVFGPSAQSMKSTTSCHTDWRTDRTWSKIGLHLKPILIQRMRHYGEQNGGRGGGAGGNKTEEDNPNSGSASRVGKFNLRRKWIPKHVWQRNTFFHSDTNLQISHCAKCFPPVQLFCEAKDRGEDCRC